MTLSIPHTNEIIQSVNDKYPLDARSDVLSTLATVDSQYLREVILILADGDQSRVDELARTVEDDYRDVLVQLDGRSGGLNESELLRRCRDLRLPVPWPWSEGTPEKKAENVKKFVASRLTFPLERLELSTCLQFEFGLTEIEGTEFVHAFAKEFKVDLTDFAPEQFFLRKTGAKPFLDLLDRIFHRSNPDVVPITVEMLITSAQNGRWEM
jgi:hypothetical protein